MERGYFFQNGQMKHSSEAEEVELDKEWVTLIQTARKYGVSVEEIRTFLRETSLLK